MDLRALTSHAGKTIFSTASPWRETVGYVPAGSTERVEISAVLARQPVDIDEFQGASTSHESFVHVANDALVGIDRPRIGDYVDFYDEEEGDRWSWEVVEIVTGDAGRWQLRVEKRGRYVA